MTRWLFFDIDDTLWDFKGNSLLSLQKLYENSGVLKNYFTGFESFSDAYHEINSEMWKLYAKGEISSEFLKTERFRKLLFPDSLSENDMDICRKLNHDYLYTLCRIPRCVDGAEDVLKSLSSRFMIGAVTNGFTDTQYTKIYTTGLWKYISRMVISDEIGIQKPDRRYFDYVFRSTGASPERSIVIGDNPDTDIAGALEAGIDAIYFNPYGKESSSLSRYRDAAFTENNPESSAVKDNDRKGKLLGEIKRLTDLLDIL